MKPSPYFADSFRFFTKRFWSKKSLLRWFVQQAGNESESFEYPPKFSKSGKILVILPERDEDVRAYIPFLREISGARDRDLTILADERHRDFLIGQSLRAETLYHTVPGCRYGESEFQKIETALRADSFTACVYLEPGPCFQYLYLAKVCKAAYRIGFDCERYYPLLNLSLHAGTDPEKRSEFLIRQFSEVSA